MIKKVILILLLLLLVNFVFFGHAVQVVPLPDLVNPRKIAVDDNQLYIAEKIPVFIYSLKDFKLIKKFGKEGEGPREFKSRITRMELQPGYIFINSSGKVSYFTKDGTFIKEFRTVSPDLRLKPFGDRFAGERMTSENSTLYNVVGIYDSSLKKIAEVYRQEREVQVGGKGTKVFAHPMPYYICDDKLFVVTGPDFVIDVLDKTAKKQYTVTYDYKRIKVTAEDKKRVMNHLETDPNTKPYLEMLKPIIFPDYFPAIRNYYVADGKVYVLTYKEENGKSEWLVFDIKGKFLKQFFLPYHYMNPVDEYPAAVKNEKLYQLIENEDTEAWELHITGIK